MAKNKRAKVKEKQLETVVRISESVKCRRWENLGLFWLERYRHREKHHQRLWFIRRFNQHYPKGKKHLLEMFIQPFNREVSDYGTRKLRFRQSWSSYERLKPFGYQIYPCLPESIAKFRPTKNLHWSQLQQMAFPTTTRCTERNQRLLVASV